MVLKKLKAFKVGKKWGGAVAKWGDSVPGYLEALLDVLEFSVKCFPIEA